MAPAKKATAVKAATDPALKKTAGKKTAGKKTAEKKTAWKKTVGKKTAVAPTSPKTTATPKPPSRQSVSLPASGKDPKGGLTAAGRKIYNDATGGHLKPGVSGKADTPEKMVRKGTFLRRHFANPPGPVIDAEGKPTRQALQAAAWGEPVPKDEADERKLAEKGAKLLEQYHEGRGEVKTASGRWQKAGARTAQKKGAVPKD